MGAGYSRRPMKLVIAIVHPEDAGALVDALTDKDFRVTRLHSQGGFLKQSHATILAGVEEAQVDDVIATDVAEAAVAPNGLRVAFIHRISNANEVWGYDVGLRATYLLVLDSAPVSSCRTSSSAGSGDAAERRSPGGECERGKPERGEHDTEEEQDQVEDREDVGAHDARVRAADRAPRGTGHARREDRVGRRRSESPRGHQLHRTGCARPRTIPSPSPRWVPRTWRARRTRSVRAASRLRAETRWIPAGVELRPARSTLNSPLEGLPEAPVGALAFGSSHGSQLGALARSP